MAVLSVGAVVSAGDATKCFPDSFLFGTATAAYQVEGGWQDAGRTPSIWDDFCRARGDAVACANVADDFYHRYKQDVGLMADMGLTAFRFSISWSRVMHWDAASRRMTPTPEGIAFYRSLLGELLAGGMAPVVTLYHWDLPSELHTQLSPPGWLNPEIVGHFVQFAELMFSEFGSQVPFWATFNEPWSFTTQGYGSGRRAPGMNDSATNEYLAAHHVLLAHAEAVARFHERRSTPGSSVRVDARISIVLNLDTAYPLDASSAADVAAAERKMQFGLGWYLQPIVSGEYPAVMRAIAGDRLPTFTAAQASLLRGSYDLFMLNHYSSKVVTDCGSPDSHVDCTSLPLGWARDLGIDDSRIPEDSRPASLDASGRPNCAWFSGYPPGYLTTIKWMSAHDPSAEILLTENGWCGNDQVDNLDQLWYFQAYLEQVHKAIFEHAIPIIGYTAWSFVDNYEWGSYLPRFGLFHVNFTAATGRQDERTPSSTALQRVPRPAARWFAQLAHSKCLSTSAASASDSGSTAPRLITWTLMAVVVVAVVVLAALFARRQRAGPIGERSPLL
jgi:beta-glucosidase/6-phospho-beta-glucosidase/beta-galactosidase